jgi:excisionase family DNA binding protein
VTETTVNHVTNSGCGADCPVCKEMLRGLERFIDMLQRTRMHACQWLTVDDVAAELKISKSIVYRIIRNGEMTATNVVETGGRMAQKGHYRIKREWLESYIEQKMVKSVPVEKQKQYHTKKFRQVKNYLGL